MRYGTFTHVLKVCFSVTCHARCVNTNLSDSLILVAVLAFKVSWWNMWHCVNIKFVISPGCVHSWTESQRKWQEDHSVIHWNEGYDDCSCAVCPNIPGNIPLLILFPGWRTSLSRMLTRRRLMEPLLQLDWSRLPTRLKTTSKLVQTHVTRIPRRN